MSDTFLFDPIPDEINFFHNISSVKSGLESLPYHRHDAYEIYLFLSGHTNMYLEHTCYQLTRGDLIIISPEELHRTVCLDSSTYERIGINIKKTTLERLSTKRSRLLNCFENHPIGENNLIHLNPDQLDEYITLCTNLKQALNSNYYGQDILSDAYLAQLLVFINTLYHTTINSYNNIMPELVSNTMFYIRNHLTEDITLKDLSSEFSYNGTYISYLFKQHTGLTLRAYILDQRLTLAKRILSEGKSVTDACEASGFRDYSNFIRTFTKEIGMSPGRYRHAKSTIT